MCNVVAVEVRSQMASQYGCSNGYFYRVLACSAGGPGFESRMRRKILRCSMQRMWMALVKPLQCNDTEYTQKLPGTGSLHLENNFLTIKFVRFASILKKHRYGTLRSLFVFIVAITTTIQNIYFRF